MPDSVIDIRFAHYREEFTDDKGFLQATYQVTLLVEKKKVLKQARDQMRTGATGSASRTEGKRREEKRSEGKRQMEGTRNSRMDQAPTGRLSPWGQPGRWATEEATLKGVPSQEHKEYFKPPESCWHCSQKGHRTYKCFAHTTRCGTPLPKAPWKATGITTTEAGKRKRSEEPEENPASKQQKITAINAMEEEPSRTLPIWADDSDQWDF